MSLFDEASRNIFFEHALGSNLDRTSFFRRSYTIASPAKLGARTAARHPHSSFERPFSGRQSIDRTSGRPMTTTSIDIL